MADQTRHAAITQFRKFLEANISQLAGTNRGGEPTRVIDGILPVGAQKESSLPVLMVIERADEIDERMTPGRDIGLRLELFWLSKGSLETQRTIEDAVIKQCYLANANQLPDSSSNPTILKMDLLASSEPMVMPDVYQGLDIRGRVVVMWYRQET